MRESVYKVSALISLYKAERFIRGRLEDLVQQTLFKRGELEIVIIDSASPDNEGTIIREYRDRFANIKYTRTTSRETLYQAWNRGIEMSEAPFLTNANADDRLCSDALEKMVKGLESDAEVGFVYGNAYLSVLENETFEEAQKDVEYWCQDYCAPDLLCHQYLGHQSMWRRAIHAKVGLFSPEYRAAGDYEFMLRGATEAKGLHIREPLGLLLRRSDSITFSDGTMNREVADIKSRYRNPEFALKLYKTEGVDVEKPGYPEACYVDLGNRALAYFPQWRGGRPDADFEFAQMCYGWALNTATENEESEKVKEWARANMEAVGVLSGVKEPGGSPAAKKLRNAEFTTHSESANKKEVALIWPELGLKDDSDLRDSALGKLSAVRGKTAGESQFRMSYVEPACYWSQLIGLSEKTLLALKSRIEANQLVMIWGACDRGLLMSKVLTHHGIKITGFIDNDPDKIGKEFGNLPVTEFDFREARDSNWKAILAVSEQQSQFVLDQLDDCGVREFLIRL